MDAFKFWTQYLQVLIFVFLKAVIEMIRYKGQATFTEKEAKVHQRAVSPCY